MWAEPREENAAPPRDAPESCKMTEAAAAGTPPSPSTALHPPEHDKWQTIPNQEISDNGRLENDTIRH